MLSGRKTFGAKDEIRTRDPDLGKVVLYQLSYFRIIEHLRCSGRVDHKKSRQVKQLFSTQSGNRTRTTFKVTGF